LKIDCSNIVITAKSGKAALQIIQTNIKDNQAMGGRKQMDVDLIMMDCNMPFMDGYETTQKIRDMIYSEGLPQPIICAVTGHTEQ